MNKLHSILMVLVTGLALLAVTPDDAFAKRLGGGKSFGGRPSYSQSYRPGAEASSGYRAPQAASQPSAQRNQAMRDSFRTRGGLMGMLGGLALGGLFGAMLFGGGFEHINLFDLLVLGLGAYLLYRVFAAMRRSRWEPLATGANRSPHRAATTAAVDIEPEKGQRTRQTGARFDTNVLFRNADQTGLMSPGQEKTVEPLLLPAGFDTAAFLEGAKSAYQHLQAAWDEGDLAELRALTTASVFAELHQQLQQRSGSERTEVISLDALLLDVSDHGSAMQASVMFEAMIRESHGEKPAEVREVWHFVRDNGSRQPTWFLDGIQQVNA
jgi:predicted lipid-binding transport protein (Tim44 family)